MGAGVGEQVRKLELDAYQAFLKVTAVTGMSWVSATSAAPLSAPTVPPNEPHISPTIRGDASRSRIPALPSQERDDLATKLRQELNISNDDHTRIREKLSDDERIKTIR
jgi:hypothetical protein